MAVGPYSPDGTRPARHPALSGGRGLLPVGPRARLRHGRAGRRSRPLPRRAMGRLPRRAARPARRASRGQDLPRGRRGRRGPAAHPRSARRRRPPLVARRAHPDLPIGSGVEGAAPAVRPRRGSPGRGAAAGHAPRHGRVAPVVRRRLPDPRGDRRRGRRAGRRPGLGHDGRRGRAAGVGPRGGVQRRRRGRTPVAVARRAVHREHAAGLPPRHERVGGRGVRARRRRGRRVGGRRGGRVVPRPRRADRSRQR